MQRAPSPLSCLFLSLHRLILWRRKCKYGCDKQAFHEIAIVYFFAKAKLRLCSGIRRVFRNVAKHLFPFCRWLDEQLVVTDEGKDLAVEVKRLLTKHLPIRECTGQPGLLTYILDRTLVACHFPDSNNGFQNA